MQARDREKAEVLLCRRRHNRTSAFIYLFSRFR